MKKYLITAALAVAISGAFVSCSDDVSYDSLIEQKAKTFEQTFIEAYGTPAPNHTWGFKKNTVTRSTEKESHTLLQDFGLTKPTLQDGEAAYVMQWFRDNPDDNSVGLDITKYFIIFVGGNTTVNVKHHDWDGNYYNNNRNNGATSNFFDVYSTQTSILDQLWIDGEHIKDWNANGGVTELVYDRKADNFIAHNSFCDVWTTKWKLAQITYNGETGWYVGLSSYAKKLEGTYETISGSGEYDDRAYYTDYDREDFYDDYVFKIVPAESVPDEFEETTIIEHEEIVEAGRVFCEDLGASSRSDIDYNDVVFDGIIVHEWKMIDGVKVSDGYYAKVCLLAAGGTIPVTVGGHEIHGVLSENKVGTNIMINTIKEEDRAEVKGAGVFQHAPVVIDRIDNVTSLDGIQIYALYNNKIVEVTNNGENLAPYKICVPIGTRWAKERVDIGIAYKDFSEYCKTGPEVKFWEEETKISSKSLWDDSATPSPFLGYKEGQVIKHDVVTMKTFWKNNGGGAADWGNSNYRFAVKGKGTNECLATFSQTAWNKIKTSTFYLVVEGENPQIRVTNGWWDANWQSDDIKPGNSLLTKNVDEDGEWDGTWTLTVNLAGSDLANTIDEKHLLFTGQGFTPVKLFYIE